MAGPSEPKLPLVLVWRIRASGVYQLALGAVILIGGVSRFSVPAFAAPRVFAPYWGWGVVIAALGVGTLSFQRIPWRVFRAGMIGMGLVMLFFAVALAASAGPATVPLTGVPTYAFIGVSHFLTALGVEFDGVTTDVRPRR